MDQATMANAINDMFRQVESENRTRVIKDENGTNRIIEGRYPDGTYGMRVSKPGKDVLTSTGTDLVFDSNNNLFNIVKSGTTTLTLPVCQNGSSVDTSISVSHTLGYAPLVIAFAYVPSSQASQTDVHFFGKAQVDTGNPSGSDIPIVYVLNEKIQVSQNSINFYIKETNATGFAQPALTYNIKYYLLTETRV